MWLDLDIQELMLIRFAMSVYMDELKKSSVGTKEETVEYFVNIVRAIDEKAVDLMRIEGMPEA